VAPFGCELNQLGMGLGLPNGIAGMVM